MSDLGERLDRRGDRFALEPGALDRTLARGHRVRRRRQIGTTVLALVLGVAGLFYVASAFRGEGPVPADHGAPADPSSRSIPDGVYWTRPITRKQLLATMTAAGFSKRDASTYYFDPTLAFRRTIRVGLVVQDGFWFQTARSDSGAQEAGWSGTFRVVGSGRVQARGYGCTITYRFSISRRSLTLHLLRESGTNKECGRGDTIAQTAIFDSAPFVRER